MLIWDVSCSAGAVFIRSVMIAWTHWASTFVSHLHKDSTRTAAHGIFCFKNLDSIESQPRRCSPIFPFSRLIRKGYMIMCLKKHSWCKHFMSLRIVWMWDSPPSTPQMKTEAFVSFYWCTQCSCSRDMGGLWQQSAAIYWLPTVSLPLSRKRWTPRIWLPLLCKPIECPLAKFLLFSL